MRSTSRFVILAVTAIALAATSAAGQSPKAAVPAEGLCRARACGLVIDWGMHGAFADINDLRYGHTSEFGARVRQQLISSGYLFTDDATKAPLTVVLRPEYIFAPCDVVPGTGSSEKCRTVGRVRVEFTSDDSAGRPPKDFRVMNRCGNGEFMTVARFGLYTAEMLDRALDSGKKQPRPSLECRPGL
jgi:hypothetical protein